MLQQRTPPFLAWAIRFDCSLKRYAIDQSPLATERILRPLRAWSEADVENRIVESICIAPNQTSTSIEGTSEDIWGFDLDEVLEPYGGVEKITDQCSSCPANASATGARPIAASCYGWLPIEGSEYDLVSIHQELLEQNKLSSFPTSTTLETNPAWHGLWAKPSYSTPDELGMLASYADAWLLELRSRSREHLATKSKDAYGVRAFRPDAPSLFVSDIASELSRFLRALELCKTHRFELTIQTLPGGLVKGRKWYVDAHCSRCHHPMSEKDRFCSACRKQGGPHPRTKRSALGIRPYLPIQMFCPSDKLARVQSHLSKSISTPEAK